MKSVAIVGASLAGAKAAEALRDEGFDGQIRLIGAETELPYERPPLSKGYLTGTADRDSVFVKSADWYDTAKIELELGTEVRAIERDGHRLLLDAGRTVEYDKLLLTTGSQVRKLDVLGGDLDGVHYLRTLADSDSLRESIANSRSIVIIGAGWIGLEVAAAARAADVAVTMVDPATLPLVRVLGSEVAEMFAALHRSHGVDLRLEMGVSELVGDGTRVSGVRLTDGTVVDADAVVVGVGITPRTQLADECGLVVDNGVMVDESLKCSDPDIFAAGDVANAFHTFYGTHVRLEHWANALNQPKVAAQSMLGKSVSYDRLPYFFSDQYDLGLEYTGYVSGNAYDEVVFRGDKDSFEFIAFWCREKRVLAGINVNVWDVTESIKTLIKSRQAVDPKRLADPAIGLDELI